MNVIRKAPKNVKRTPVATDSLFMPILALQFLQDLLVFIMKDRFPRHDEKG